MTSIILLACLHGPCVIHDWVMQIPMPPRLVGPSESMYLREYRGPAVIVYVPAGMSI